MAAAGDGSDNEPPPSPPPPPSTIVAEVETPDAPDTPSPGGGGGGTVNTSPPRILCSWNDIGTNAADIDVRNERSVWIADVLAPVNGYFDMEALVYYERFGVLHRWGTPSSGGGEGWIKAQRASCPANNTDGYSDGQWRWVTSVPPDPATLLDGPNGTTRRVTEAVNPPVPGINPAGSGYVNLGMWLSVEEAGPYVARAQIPESGPAQVWAETRATIRDTTFVFGDGGQEQCDGFGTPIPASAVDDVAEGPCGYTFSDFSGDTTIEITSRWDVTWALSDGRTGGGTDADMIVLTVTVPYEVLEIQTVGVADP